jgi:hypothetical protein
LIIFAPHSLLAAAISFDVSTDDGSVAYIIDGESNPTLTLTRNELYTFEIDAVGQPFWLKTSSGSGLINIYYDDGLTGYGMQSGSFEFTVSASAPNTLYYCSQYQASMCGTITIVDAVG